LRLTGVLMFGKLRDEEPKFSGALPELWRDGDGEDAGFAGGRGGAALPSVVCVRDPARDHLLRLVRGAAVLCGVWLQEVMARGRV
jgi:hypothetical protein